MISKSLQLIVAALTVSKAAAYTVSATSTESVTAPIDFLWPEERPWYAAYQNESPCGTNATVGNRTDFPLDSGLVSLTIAGNAYSLAFRIAYMNDPTSQSDFTTEFVHTVSEVAAGHQCYSTPDTPSSITAGTNATIQLEYTSQYNGSAYEIFYTCADITFVETSAFKSDVACFNATVTGPSSDPIASSASTTTSSTTASSSSSSSTSSSKSSNSNGLSVGQKAGIAVGVVVASLGMVAALAFATLRKRAAKKAKDAEAASVQDLKHKESFTSNESTN